MRTLQEVEERLGRPLDEKYVDQQDGFDYVPSWYVIWKANEIFGVNGWDSRTLGNEVVNYGFNIKKDQGNWSKTIKEVSLGPGGFTRAEAYDLFLSKIEDDDDYFTTEWAEAKAIVQVQIRIKESPGLITRTGSGQGSGWGRERFGDAVKTAESDAQKRALRTFGNQFGLPLYVGDGSLEMDWDEQDWFGPKQKGVLRQKVSELNLDVPEAAAAFARASEEQLSVEEALEHFKEVAED